MYFLFFVCVFYSCVNFLTEICAVIFHFMHLSFIRRWFIFLSAHGAIWRAAKNTYLPYFHAEKEIGPTSKSRDQFLSSG